MRDATSAVMERAVPFAIDSLSRIADAELHDTAQTYKDGLHDAVAVKGATLKIELKGVAKDIEVGYPARDMKPALLASASAKQSKKGGKYIDIPFKHKLNALPDDIKAKAQAAVRTERAAAKAQNRPEKSPMRVTGSMPGGTNAQERLHFLRSKRGAPIGLSKSGIIHLIKHKTSIYSNMIRTKVGTSGVYGTIRRISSKSDPQSWFHPGFKGIHALQRIKSDLRMMMRQALKQELSR